MKIIYTAGEDLVVKRHDGAVFTVLTLEHDLVLDTDASYTFEKKDGGL